MRGWLASAMLAATATACGASLPTGDNAYGVAVEATLDEEWERGATAAGLYVSSVTESDERYDRALLLFAKNLQRMGLTYAASLYYLDIASSRRNVELIDDAVAGLRDVVEGGPHDEEVLVHGFLARADFGTLRPDIQSFVDYLQGLDSLRRGLRRWSNKRFASLPAESPYAYRAQYVRAVDQIAHGLVEPGKATLEALAKEQDLAPNLRLEAQLALARLLMDQERFGEAANLYEQVRRDVPDRPELLLEMAWANYYMGDSRRALGLLIALDAPVHSSLIAPRRFLLEAVSLQRLCQFDPARIAARRLERRYAEALRDLRGGIPPAESEAVRRGARLRAEVLPTWRLRNRVRKERAMLEDMADAFDAKTARRLHDLYERGLQETERRANSAIEREANRLAEELVEAEDGMGVILHEISVQLLRGRQRPSSVPERSARDLSAAGGSVTYEFRGEFWTDELDDLIVGIEDRCMEQGP